jgi:hypothetical protein
MSDPFKSPEEMDRLLHRALRGLPARRAPPSLEDRVLRELQQRSVKSWWQRSYADWPAFARGAFIAICAALMGFAALTGSQLAALLTHWSHPIGSSLFGAMQGLASIGQLIAPLWLVSGLCVAAFLYAALFGLGITAYRTLYLRL